MTSTRSKFGTMSRRGFMKAAGVATLATAAGMMSAQHWLSPTAAVAEDAPNEDIRYTYHPVNCGNRCSFECTVRDGRLVSIKGNEWSGPEKIFSVCCLKGMSEIQHVYADDRIQTPLKRTGDRGSGEFTAISWDEALSTVADAIKNTQDKYGKGAVLVPYSSGIGYGMPLLRKLAGFQSTCESGIDMAQANGLNPMLGTTNVGQSRESTYNLKYAKTIVLTGNNILETGLTDAQLLLEAQEAGAKLIVIDPVYTATASKADQWISIEPGTDPALYLGMASVLLDEGLYDEDFLKAHTSAAFLVGDDGLLVRANAEREDAEGEPISGEANPFMVWDNATQSVQPYNKEGVDPALEGTFDHQGMKVSTTFTKLMENQEPYTTAWASDLTGIDKDTIAELARTIATQTPAFLGIGFGGADKYSNGDIAGHALGMLTALTGNIGTPGSGVGILCNHSAAYTIKLGSWKTPDEFKETKLEMQAPLFKSEPNSVHMVFNIGNALVQHMGNFKTTRDWLDSQDLVVTVAPYYNDSTDVSDIVLPSCTFLESNDEIGCVTTSKNHVLLQQKVIDPLFESKTDFEIEHELLDRLGLVQYAPASMSEYTKAEIAGASGITYDDLINNHCLVRGDVPEEPFSEFKDLQFKTPSGRIELYDETVKDYGQALPTWEDLLEIGKDNPKRSQYPLVFVNNRRRYRVHSQFYDSDWINQVDPTPHVSMNPKDADARGLKTGDTVRVHNDRGEIKVPVQVDKTVRSGMVLMTEGVGKKDTGKSNYEDLVNDALIERGKKLAHGAPIPYYDTLVQAEKA